MSDMKIPQIRHYGRWVKEERTRPAVQKALFMSRFEGSLLRHPELLV
jgi:hypothetical protein